MAEWGANYDYGDSLYKDDGQGEEETENRHEFAMKRMWPVKSMLDTDISE